MPANGVFVCTDLRRLSIGPTVTRKQALKYVYFLEVKFLGRCRTNRVGKRGAPPRHKDAENLEHLEVPRQTESISAL